MVTQVSTLVTIVSNPAVADFQASKERKSLVLEALFEILFRVLKHAAGGPQRPQVQQQTEGASENGELVRLSTWPNPETPPWEAGRHVVS